MREDMFKVIVERPRRGMRTKASFERKNDRLANFDMEDLPQKESMKVRYGWGRELNENLNPLKRFLIKSCGKPWDLVYSEICRTLKGRSTVKQHVLDHVKHYVATKTKLGTDGRILYASYRGYKSVTDFTSGYLVYVHPITKILTEFPTDTRYRRRGTIKTSFNTYPDKKITDKCVLRYENGIWYALELMHENDFPLSISPVGRLFRDTFGYTPYDFQWYIKSKKQCSKKMLRDYKLKNIPAKL